MIQPIINKMGGYIKTAFNTVKSEYGVLFLSTGFLVKGAQGLKMLTIDNPAIKLALSIGTFAKAFFECFPAVPQLLDVKNLRSDLMPHLDELGAGATRERRIERLQKACDFIIANKKRIQTTLKISKQHKLIERANRAKDPVNLEEGEEFLRRLKTRVNQKTVTDSAQVISKTFSLTVSAVLIPMPINPVALTLAGVAGLAIFGLWGIEKILYSKDPFRPAEDIWYNKIAARVQELFTFNIKKYA